MGDVWCGGYTVPVNFLDFFLHKMYHIKMFCMNIWRFVI